MLAEKTEKPGRFLVSGLIAGALAQPDAELLGSSVRLRVFPLRSSEMLPTQKF